VLRIGAIRGAAGAEAALGVEEEASLWRAACFAIRIIIHSQGKENPLPGIPSLRLLSGCVFTMSRAKAPHRKAAAKKTCA